MSLIACGAPAATTPPGWDREDYPDLPGDWLCAVCKNFWHPYGGCVLSCGFRGAPARSGTVIYVCEDCSIALSHEACGLEWPEGADSLEYAIKRHPPGRLRRAVRQYKDRVFPGYHPSPREGCPRVTKAGDRRCITYNVDGDRTARVDRSVMHQNQTDRRV